MVGLAVAGAIGHTLGAAWNARQANHAAHQNQRYATDQMVWQEEMSNTAHQREVADLRAAGLNPILSATGGAGATTPAGQSGSLAQSGQEDFATTAREVVKYLDTQRDQIKAETDKTEAESEQTKTLTPVLKEQAETTSARNRAEADSASANAREQERQTQYWKDHPGQYAVNQWINTISSGLSMIGSLVHNIGTVANSAKVAKSIKELNHVKGLDLADKVHMRHN